MTMPTDIAALNESGQTAEQIAAALAADPVTVNDIPVNVLRPLLFVEWGLVSVDPATKQRSGPLIDLYVDERTPKEIRDGIGKLFAHLDDPTAEYVRTKTNSEWAGLWHAVVALLKLSDDQLAVLEKLHGGRKFAGVTVEQVQALIDEHDAEQAELAKQEALKPLRKNAVDGWNAFSMAADSGEIAADAKWADVRDQFWPMEN